MKSDKWYQRRLAKYFTEHYEQYEDVAEYWNDPSSNQWLFNIPELGVKIKLTCNDNGIVTEEKYPMRGLGTTMRPVDWYKGKLTDYFYENYPEFVDYSAWFINPAPNQFKGLLVEARIIILLICDDEGNITVEKTPLKMEPETLKEVLIGLSHGMSPVMSESYITYLIGEEGLRILLDNDMLEVHHSVSGLNSYTFK